MVFQRHACKFIIISRLPCYCACAKESGVKGHIIWPGDIFVLKVYNIKGGFYNGQD